MTTTAALRTLLREILKVRLPVCALLVTSFVSNLLMLTGPVFMLQVYDRVLTSHSIPTLEALTILVVGIYAFYGLVEALRARVAHGIGDVIEERWRLPAFTAHLRSGGQGEDPSARYALTDLEHTRAFVSGPALLAMLDLPWVPAYLVIVFRIHPDLGVVALIGAIAVTALMVLNQLITTRANRDAQNLQVLGNQASADAVRNAEVVRVLRMAGALQKRWNETQSALQGRRAAAAGRSSAVSSASKSIRFLLQSCVLAVGAYLVIRGEMSSGLMIAASTITSRALAPVEQIVGSWRSTSLMFTAMKRIASWSDQQSVSKTLLPVSRQTFSVSDLRAGPLIDQMPLLKRLTFSLSEGNVLAVVGPSGSGKTVLLRSLLGADPIAGGEIRIDGATTNQFDDNQWAQLVGYLPQRVELLQGTVAENIARFQTEAEPDAVVAAAKAAHVHDLIISWPEGYQTQVGTDGVALSAGQRQRIGLGRALYGNPFIVAMDEPNAHLDAEGELALARAVEELSARGAIVILAAHRPAIMRVATHVLALNNGAQAYFGPKDEATSGPRPPVALQKIPVAV